MRAWPWIALAAVVLTGRSGKPATGKRGSSKPATGPPTSTATVDAMLLPSTPKLRTQQGPMPTSWSQVIALDGGVVRDPNRTWLDSRVAADLAAALARWTLLAAPDWPRVRVLDGSREGGGPFPPHASHDRGRDVDLSFESVSGLPNEMLAALLYALLVDPNVGAVFLDWDRQADVVAWLTAWPTRYPGLADEIQAPLDAPGQGARRVRHSSGHSKHFHVRWAP